MAKFKSYNYDQTALVAVDLEKRLPPGSLEFAIHYLVDHEIDLSGLESRFRNDFEGRPAYDPRILLKIILLAYSRGIIRSRPRQTIRMVYKWLNRLSQRKSCNWRGFDEMMNNYRIPRPRIIGYWE